MQVDILDRRNKLLIRPEEHELVGRDKVLHWNGRKSLSVGAPRYLGESRSPQKVSSANRPLDLRRFLVITQLPLSGPIGKGQQ